MRISYAGKLILTDPFLAEKHSLGSFINRSLNPMVDLPYDPNEVISGVEMCIISHLHIDHFDPLAHQLLPKDIPIFCQPGDDTMIKSVGFTDVTRIESSVTWEGIEIARTPGQHGTGLWIEQMGEVSGFLLRAENEPTVYWAGDTVLYDPVREVIEENKPDIIITHSGGARFGNADPIIMDEDQTISVCKSAPFAKVVAVHLETLDHVRVTRPGLKATAEYNGIDSDQLLIPDDGQEYEF